MPGATGFCKGPSGLRLMGSHHQPDRSHKSTTAPSMAQRRLCTCPLDAIIVAYMCGCAQGASGVHVSGIQVRSSGSCLIEASVNCNGGCLWYRKNQLPTRCCKAMRPRSQVLLKLVLQDDLIPWTATEPTTTMHERYPVAFPSDHHSFISASCVATTPNAIVLLDCCSHPLLVAEG